MLEEKSPLTSNQNTETVGTISELLEKILEYCCRQSDPATEFCKCLSLYAPNDPTCLIWVLPSATFCKARFQPRQKSVFHKSD